MLVGWPRLEVPIEANVTNDFIGLATCIFDLFSREPDNFVHHIGTETAENDFYIFFFPVRRAQHIHPLPPLRHRRKILGRSR